MNSGGSQGRGGSPRMNSMRRLQAMQKLDTPLTSDWPLPAPVKRQASVAPWSFIVEPSRMSKASTAGG